MAVQGSVEISSQTKAMDAAPLEVGTPPRRTGAITDLRGRLHHAVPRLRREARAIGVVEHQRDGGLRYAGFIRDVGHCRTAQRCRLRRRRFAPRARALVGVSRGVPSPVPSALYAHIISKLSCYFALAKTILNDRPSVHYRTLVDKYYHRWDHHRKRGVRGARRQSACRRVSCYRRRRRIKVTGRLSNVGHSRRRSVVAFVHWDARSDVLRLTRRSEFSSQP